MKITHTCGHTSKVSPKDEWKANGLCYDCWKAEQDAYKAEKREAERDLAEANAEEHGLPELQGSEKQVAWALTLRDKWYTAYKTIKQDALTWDAVKDMDPKAFDAIFGSTRHQASPEAFEEMVSELRGILKQTNANWWIDSRNTLGAWNYSIRTLIGQSMLALQMDYTSTIYRA